eukprot:PhM_4_TR15847/c0_g1_i1/m.52581/K06911/K06911; uncharacterized protein
MSSPLEPVFFGHVLFLVVLLSVLVVDGLDEREVHSIHDCTPTTDGQNVAVNRCLGGNVAPVSYLNPFLVFDSLHVVQQKSNKKNSEDLPHFPAHPHMGFIEVRYMLSGEMHHNDSCGTTAVTTSGGLHVFNTASGIVHEEKFKFTNGVLKLLQIWLRTGDDEGRPSFRNYQESDIPIVTDFKFGCYTIRNVTSVLMSNRSSGGLRFADVTLHKPSSEMLDCKFVAKLNAKQHAIMYILAGSVLVHTAEPVLVEADKFVVLGAGDYVSVRAYSTPARFVLLTAPRTSSRGRVFQSQGFVAGSEEEIAAAHRRLENGFDTHC